MRRNRILSLTILATLAITLLPAAAQAAPSKGRAAGRYIVALHPRMRGVEAQADRLARKHEGRAPDHVFSHSVKGFSMRLSGRAADALAKDPAVASIRPDHRVRAFDVQPSAPWPLDRIDQRDLPLDESYSYTSDGAGVTAYVIDTGIRTTHAEFGGRASIGYDALEDGQEDCDGHGTHVAGSIGGATYGVAKSVDLVGVRVLDCEGGGYMSDVIAGVDWVTENAIAPAVVNMSLGGPQDSLLDDAVAASIASGLTYVVAAGNEGEDACLTSPSSVESALTVSATDATDARPSWANVGTCVDLLAPGVNITSAGIGSDSHTLAASGTSMSAPHVAGVAARSLGANTEASPAAVASAILSSASSGKITSLGTGTPNLLLHSEQVAPGSGKTLTVTRSGTGSGIVTSSPAGVSCGSACVAEFETGKVVTLTPSPATGSGFRGWSGACTGTGACTVTLTADTAVGAAFARTTPVLRDLGFESGPTSPYWNLLGGAEISSVSRRTGSYAADLCGRNNCYEGIDQAITVPTGLQSAVFTYSFRGTTTDDPSGCYDGLLIGLATVDVPEGEYLKVHCNNEATGAWRTGLVDLTSRLQARAGQTVLIFADTDTDESYPTRFFVDNVNLKLSTSADNVAPTVGFTGSAFAKFQTSTSRKLGWTGIDAAGPVASYDVRYRRARYNGSFGSRTYWRYATTATSGTFPAAAGYTYCFSVRARDMMGNQSAWSAERCTAFPVNDRTLSATSSWTRVTRSSYYLGTATRGSATGAYLKRSVAAKRVALVATKCSTCGKVDVSIGSTVRRISLYSSTTKRKQVIPVWTFTSVKTGTLKIKIVSSGKRVYIEGVGISRT